MKKCILFCLVFMVLVPFAVSAQEKTLITGEVEHGGGGGPVVKLTSLNNTFCVLTGGYGGWIIDHTFLLGGGGYGLATDVFVSGNKLQFGYGGLVAEYIYMSDALLHFKAGALIGAGSAHYDPDGSDAKGFFVIEPGIDAEINITSFFRVNAGVSYRIVIGATGIAGLNDSLLSGLAGEIVAKFGMF